jgi:ABC-type glycerol-3-phosphate transport system substrate-binding protein
VQSTKRQSTLWRRLTLIILLASWLGACVPAPTSVPPAGQPLAETRTPGALRQDLILWYAFGGTAEAGLLQLIDDFNVHNMWHINVTAERLQDADDLRAHAVAAGARNTLPDLAIVEHAAVADIVQAGLTVPLEPYVSDVDFGLSQSSLQDLLYEVRPARYDRQIVAWPLGREIVTLVYNTKWLASMGLEKPPEYWSEFREVACAASGDMDGDGAYDHYGYGHAQDVTAFAGWLYSRGTRVLDPEGERAQFGDDAGLQAFSLLSDLFKQGCAHEAGGSAGLRADFAAGRVLFVFARSSELAGYERAVANGEDFTPGVVAMPGSGVVSPTVPLAGPDMVIFRTTADRQLAAWLFTRYLTEPAQTVRWAQLTGQFPVRRSAIESTEMQAYLAQHPLVSAAWSLLPAATSEEGVPGWSAVYGILGDALQQVIDGQRPVPVIVQDAVNRANQALASP